MKNKELGGGLQLKRVFRRPGKRGKLLIGIFLLLSLSAGAAGIIFWKTGRQRHTDVPFENMPEAGMQFSMTENMMVGNGVTGVGITEELFEVENLSAKLEIEEVYVGAEDIVEKGDKVLKLSDASITEAREELEKARREADLAYRAGKIEYEQSKITLEYERDSKVLGGEQAKAVYEETLSGLQDTVDKAKEELEEANEEIAEYRSYVSDASYESYFKVDEYQTAYDETLDALKDKMDEWGVSWPQVTGGSAGAAASGSTGADGVSGNDLNGEIKKQNAGASKDQIEVLASLYKVLEKEAKKLEQAESDCEDAVVNGIFELQTLELKMPELEQKLTEAEKDYETEVLQAKVTYEKVLADAESAQSDYETALRKAETTYEKLKSAWEDAEENLALFESSVGDGYYYASDSGTVLRTMVRKGGELTAEGMIFVYSNPKEMTASVSVNQMNIAGIALGDTVYIQTENGGYEGVVTKIDPVSDSDSRTDVSYSVVVKFVGETEDVSANESVAVVFGMDEEAIREAISAAKQSGQDAAFGKERSGQDTVPEKEQVSGNEGGRRRP